MAIVARNPGSAAYPAHQIWGSLEASSCEGSSESASAHRTTQVGGFKDVSARQRRMRNLPLDLQQHLRGVVFHEESRSSEAHVEGSSSFTPAHKLKEQQLLRLQAANTAFQRAALAFAEDLDAAKPRRAVWSEEEDDHTANASSDGSFERAQDAAEASREPAATSTVHRGAVDAAEAAASSAAPVLEGESRWSRGSALHAEGKCRPCHYVHTKLGCLNGQDCSFCHSSHSTKSKPRPCKAKRMQCKRIVGMIETAASRDPEQFSEASKVLAKQSPYLQSMIQPQPPAQTDGSVDDTGPGKGAIASFLTMLRGSSSSSGNAVARSTSEEIASI